MKRILIVMGLMGLAVTTIQAGWQPKFLKTLSISDKYIVCDVFTSTGINACIDLLGSGGGEVYLPEGTYTITTAIVIDQSSTTLTGAGAGTILDASAGFEGPAPVAVIDTNDKDYVTIQSLTIIGKAGDGDNTNLIGDNDTANYLIVQNCELVDSDSKTIEIAGRLVIIINNYIDNSDSTGLKLNGAEYLVSNNRILNGGGHGVYGTGDNGVIVGNICISNTLPGIQVLNADFCTISGNMLKSNGEGIHVLTSDYNSVAGNTIIDIGPGPSTDIKVTGDFNIITGNVCYGNGTSDKGIWLDEADECVVTGNFTDNHDVAGIQEDADCQDNLIYGNNAQDSTPYVLNGTLPEAVSVPTQTTAQLATITPQRTGEPYFNSTTGKGVISTGTAVGQFSEYDGTDFDGT